jgi:hypothetical protein
VSTPYATEKIHAEPMSQLPFQWRDNLPKRGWKIMSESSEMGRRELIVSVDGARLSFRRTDKHGREGSNRQKNEKILNPTQMAEALAIVNPLWATTPQMGSAHRTRLSHLVTLIMVDRDVFKSYSSANPADDLHRFNEILWSWALQSAIST